MHIEPSNQTFSELMSNSTRYVVPRFQRNYSWQQEQWEDLWNDIQELGTEDAHYMGYISTIAATGSVNDTELDELDEKWSGLLAQLGENNFTDFVRYLFNSPHSFVTKKELFKWVKASVNNFQSWLAERAVRTWRVDHQ